MEDISVVRLEQILQSPELVHAHTSKVKRAETLPEHTALTQKYLYKLSAEKGIGQVLESLTAGFKLEGKELNGDCKALLKEMFVNAVVLHDIGKINPAFQKCKMENRHIKSCPVSNSDHSILSALIFIDIFEEKISGIKSEDEKYFLYNVLYSFAYSISRHHTHLKDMNEFLDKLEKTCRTFKKALPVLAYKSDTMFSRSYSVLENSFSFRHEGYKHWQLDEIAFYILNKLLFSLIVSSDFYAAYEYFTGEEADFGLIENIDEVFSIYKSTDRYRGIIPYRNNKTHETPSPMNDLRSRLFLEAEENLLKEIDKNIFFLEAPTGSGKTNTSINLALNLVKNSKGLNRIFYVFPFNTLVEQTKETFENIFPAEFFAVINSITPVVTKEEEKEQEDEKHIDYEKSYLDRLFMHYPIVITTHVNLFNCLFGAGKEANFPIVQLCNSVIILDEVQSYRNEIWTEIIMFLQKFSRILNLKIIIMSATLPRLDRLLFERSDFAALISDPGIYFENPLFKNRVRLDFSMLLIENITLYDIADKVEAILNERGKAKVLVEFIKKGTARDFFNIIKNRCGGYLPVIELTGDDNIFTRRNALLHIRNEESIIVVATQVIEAGVDIDMDIGLKDISLLDSEEQFLGRINRSCLKQGKDCTAFFFDFDRAQDIYREDLRIEKGLKDESNQAALADKQFEKFYDRCFERIKIKNNELNKNNIGRFLKECLELDFENICKRMRLINQKNFQVFLAYCLDTGTEIIDGQELWVTYKRLYEDNTVSYSQKKIELSRLYEKMSYFTYSISAYGDTFKPPFFTEEFGNYYYVENGNEFITEDFKFDRDKYCGKSGGLFL